MSNLREGVDRGAADALGWRVRNDQRRIFLFEVAQLPNQAVVLGIRYLRVVEHVIAVVVMLDFGTQPVDALPDACRHRLHQNRRSRLLRCSNWTSSSRRLRIRCAVSVLPCSSCNWPFMRSARLRPVARTRSNVVGASSGPGMTPNSEMPGNSC